MPELNPTMTVAELARALRQTTKTTLRWLARYGIRPEKIGHENHVWLSDLAAKAPQFLNSLARARDLSDDD